ncbi:hypothetical protein QBC47DRAFT_292482 [Echria macrotheca]|uniref:PAS domain-containing protein n=1 Tax=Echria macrotheca TaxID=438768 RepID=A0AAJ0BMC4_9PEZI|nr:hypothetical protein QBC47DRAFT_292482 [Echria macrotheca]
MSAMNTWEAQAYQVFPYGHSAYSGDSQAALFYPGIYSRAEYDMLSILAQVEARPNPQIQLGPVDLSCAIIVCDLSAADEPIVYANSGFSLMTGYTLDEVRGKNCRFLQAPPEAGPVRPRSARRYVAKDTIRKMRKALDKRAELQVEVVNFKKNGESFVNILTMIPVVVDGRTLCVGFQCEKE